MALAATSIMNEAEARECVLAVNSHLLGARALLLELYEREGWRALGYDSWRACVISEFDQSQSHLYRQLEAARLERELAPDQIGVLPERRLREIAAAPAEMRQELFEQARALPTRDLSALVREARTELTLRVQLDPMPARPREIGPTVVSVGEPRRTARLYVGDVRDVLGRLEPEFAQCVMTSPPFWGLRDYKIPASVWGGDADHGHAWQRPLTAATERHTNEGFAKYNAEHYRGGGHKADQQTRERPDNSGRFCECGAWYGQLGLEPWPSLYVEHIVEAFGFVRRALKKDGVLWLEIGDSYAGSGKGPTGWSGIGDQDTRQGFSGEGKKRLAGREDGLYPDGRRVGLAKSDTNRGSSQYNLLGGKVPAGIKPKDLLGIPWRVAFALQADGWWLRQDNVWARPNPMPESVKDRTTRAHSYVFQFTKSRKCFYDHEAIAEPTSGTSHPRGFGLNPKAEADEFAQDERMNGRSHRSPASRSSLMASRVNDLVEERNKRSVWTVPTRQFKGAHFATFPPDLIVDPIKATSRPGDVVLDPFVGAGTVPLVAARLGRDSVGIDASDTYIRAIAARRLTDDAPMLVEVLIES